MSNAEVVVLKICWAIGSVREQMEAHEESRAFQQQIGNHDGAKYHLSRWEALSITRLALVEDLKKVRTKR